MTAPFSESEPDSVSRGRRGGKTRTSPTITFAIWTLKDRTTPTATREAPARRTPGECSAMDAIVAVEAARCASWTSRESSRSRPVCFCSARRRSGDPSSADPGLVLPAVYRVAHNRCGDLIVYRRSANARA